MGAHSQPGSRRIQQGAPALLLLLLFESKGHKRPEGKLYDEEQQYHTIHARSVRVCDGQNITQQDMCCIQPCTAL